MNDTLFDELEESSEDDGEPYENVEPISAIEDRLEQEKKNIEEYKNSDPIEVVTNEKEARKISEKRKLELTKNTELNKMSLETISTQIDEGKIQFNEES